MRDLVQFISLLSKLFTLRFPAGELLNLNSKLFVEPLHLLPDQCQLILVFDCSAVDLGVLASLLPQLIVLLPQGSKHCLVVLHLLIVVSFNSIYLII